MRYIRTKNGIYNMTGKVMKDTYDNLKGNEVYLSCDYKQADTIKELIMIGDLIVWYNGSSKRDEYFYIHNEDELFAAKQYPIKQVFLPTNNGTEFRLAAEMNDKEN